MGIGLLQGLLPQERISWQAHLFGAIGGVLAAFALARRAEGEHPRLRRAPS
jgi:membrane associated rhomboid family serine protease